MLEPATGTAPAPVAAAPVCVVDVPLSAARVPGTGLAAGAATGEAAGTAATGEAAG